MSETKSVVTARDLDQMKARHAGVINKMAWSIGVMLALIGWVTSGNFWIAVLVAFTFAIGWVSGAKRLPFGRSYDDEIAQGAQILAGLSTDDQDELFRMVATGSKAKAVQHLQSLTGEKMRPAMFAVDVMKGLKDRSEDQRNSTTS